MHLLGLSLLLTAHLLLVNIAMLGPIVALWHEWRGSRLEDAVRQQLARRMAGYALLGLILGSVLGGVLLAGRYVMDERYFRAIAKIPIDRQWFALAELLFSLLCLSLFYGMWDRWKGRWRIIHRLVALAGASNLMMHFPALFAMISILAARPGLSDEPLTREEFRNLLVDPQIMSRVLHVWLAGLAASGLLLVWLAVREGRRLASKQDATQSNELAVGACQRMLQSGGRLAMFAVMLQFPVGLWVALAMPEATRMELLGGDILASLFFMSAVALAMLQMHLLSALILGEGTIAQARNAILAFLVLMLLMVTTRMRVASLERPTLAERPSNTCLVGKQTVARYAAAGQSRAGGPPAI